MAKLSLGTLTNSGSDSLTALANQIELLFEVQSLVHEGLAEGGVYSVSVAAEFDQDILLVAQDTLTYDSAVVDNVRKLLTITRVSVL